MMKMMSVQLKIWKRLITNRPPLSSHHQLIFPLSTPIPLPFISKPHVTFPNFCSQTTTPSTTLPERGVASEFFLNKCGLSEKDIARAFRECNYLLLAKSTQYLEEVLELINGYGLTTSDQIRKVVLRNPKFFFYKAKKNLQPKLTLLKTIMVEEDISKLLIADTLLFDAREDNLKSVIPLLQGLGFEGRVLSELLVTQPSLLRTTEEKAMKLFKQAEDLGFKKGSKSFAYALREIWGGGKHKLRRTLQFLSSLGFSEKRISEFASQEPRFLGLPEEKLKSTVDFMVKYVELPLADLVKYPHLLTFSLERRIIPRYRVMEELTPVQMRDKIPFVRIFYLKEKRFLKKYVNKNAKASVLQTIYYGQKAGKFTTDK